MDKPFLPPLRRLLIPALIASLCLVVALAGTELQLALRYERDALGGEPWRMLSGHFVHLGWSHLWLNLAGLVLIWMLVGSAFSAARWGAVLVATTLGVSAGLWFMEPQLAWYVGLSGVLHGLLVAGALASIGHYRDAPLLLGLVVLKLAWEQWMGPMPGSEAASGGPVVVSAHLYGALSGAAGWLLLRMGRGERAEAKVE
jgi:rhomboid family GlyGly-CTERM serine protease